MKLVCDFCKTEYTLTKLPATSVRCAICGHVWSPHSSFSLNRVWLKFLVVICALIAACIFSFVAIVKFHNSSEKNKPLVARIDEQNIRIVTDKDGKKNIFISGDITNNTDEIYGLPNILIMSYDADNNLLSRQKFMPPATFLEPKSTVTFNHLLSVDPTNVKRVSVELKEYK